MEAGGAGGAALARALLDALPPTPREQLAVASAIAARAMELQAGQLESEVQQLRRSLRALEARNTALEADAREQREQADCAAAEQRRLASENFDLAESVSRLTKEVARLERLRRSLLKQLQDGADGVPTPPPRVANGGGNCAPQRLAQDETLSACGQGALGSGGGGGGGGGECGWDAPAGAADQIQGALVVGSIGSGAGGAGGQLLALDHEQRGRDQEGGYFSSGGGGGDGCSGGGGGPALGGSLTACGAAAGPDAATPARVDGREFFRRARSRLSYKGFSQFLAAIKLLNAGRASRADTLGAARELFGDGNSDLYSLFEGLLSRHCAPTPAAGAGWAVA
ncbi:hypothetical protein Rsub_08095 [Raphidocelis subcapitata]|uniref:At4g15545-like C-terminal domain-containing protein n=1 Tax=Raphidocelis subcapitata TaxID=307507 RepID=A0A2V0PAK0_9CHLO|nr:hypothetical protein Rsub_08095 [Raphidocelis subcapitata]|eukprot:GBF95972.1 hypothetical protein Rsub_08095 [Raphidocelis subcapitata]